MLNRIAGRPSLPLSTYVARCKTCQCACGAVLQPQISPLERTTPAKRRRYVSTKPRAPTTRTLERSHKAVVLSPELARKQKEIDDVIAAYSSQVITELCSKGHIKSDVRSCLEFVEAFQELASKVHTGNEVNLESFRTLLHAFGVEHLGGLTQPEYDIFLVALVLLNGPREAESIRKLGKRLMFSCSAVGSVWATIQILHHAALQSIDRPSVLKSAELIRPRAQLQRLVQDGKSFEALTLEGKIKLREGDEASALRCFKEALPLAVRWAEQQETVASKYDDKAKAKELQDTDALRTPWIELYRLHDYRRACHMGRLDAVTPQSPEAEKVRLMVQKERSGMEEAIKIGLVRDDPYMVLKAATFSKKWSADWLYYMSKAAASGMVQAMHALAVFYSTSPWKYLKDEPPDHVKPTAFDSFPKPDLIASTARLTSFLSNPFSAKKIDAKQGNDKEKVDVKRGREEIFHTAAWPSTARDRVRLALEWLEVAAGNTYVPSALEAARLYLMIDLPPGLDAPKGALMLKESRYDFENQKEYVEASRPGGVLDQTTNLKIPEHVEGAEHKPLPRTSLPNPWYDEDKARHHIREIFFAAQAIQFRNDLLQKKRALPRRTVVSNFAHALDRDDGRIDRFDLQPAKAKYLKSPTVRELYEKELPQVVVDAKEICDKMGWQIRDVDDGLLYEASPT